MRRTVAALLLGSAVAASSAGETLLPDDFAAQFALGRVVEGLNAVELTEAAYRAGAHRSLRDLRIFNASGEALPWAVLPQPPRLPPDVRVIDLALAPLPVQTAAREAALQAYAVRFESDRERAVLEIKGEPGRALSSPTEVGSYLIDARAAKDRRGRLRLDFGSDATDFAGPAEVSGSEDLVHWKPLVRGPLAHERRLGGETIEKNRFEIANPPSFLRVGWTGAGVPQIAAARFEALTQAPEVLPRTVLATTLGDDARHLYADLPPALPVEHLLVRMPQANMAERFAVYRHVADPAPGTRRPGPLPRRAPEHWIAAGTIDAFRVTRDGVEVEAQPLAFGVATDGIRVDAPRPFAGALPILEAEWRPARIAFVARAPGPYLIAIGHTDAPSPAPLDLRALLPADDAAGLRLPVATIEPLAVATGGPDARAARIAAQAHWSRLLLWSVLALAVLGLAWMAWRLWTQLRASEPAGRDGPR